MGGDVAVLHASLITKSSGFNSLSPYWSNDLQINIDEPKRYRLSYTINGIVQVRGSIPSRSYDQPDNMATEWAIYDSHPMLVIYYSWVFPGTTQAFGPLVKSGLSRFPVKEESAGSNPVWVAKGPKAMGYLSFYENSIPPLLTCPDNCLGKPGFAEPT